MATGTRASNYKARANKWKPYMHKNFYLGTTMNTDGEDGGGYIWDPLNRTQPTMKAYCDDDLNSTFCYRIIFNVVAGGGYGFTVKKYRDVVRAFLDVLEEDTIYASATSGNGRYWEIKDSTGITDTRGSWVTIDIGVHIQIEGDVSDYTIGDYYVLRMPDCEADGTNFIAGSEEGIDSMKKRRLYFGGYHTYLQLPTEEGTAFHSDIIPHNLTGKNLTCIFGKIFSTDTGHSSWHDTLRGCFSMADDTGNSAVSVYLEWSANKDAATSSNAGSTAYSWGTDEEWMLGTAFAVDIDPSTSLNPEDRMIHVNAPGGDTDASITTTGTLQVLNVQTFGRAGYSRIRTSFDTGTGSSTMQAHNQFWPCTILIN